MIIHEQSVAHWINSSVAAAPGGDIPHLHLEEATDQGLEKEHWLRVGIELLMFVRDYIRRLRLDCQPCLGIGLCAADGFRKARPQLLSEVTEFIDDVSPAIYLTRDENELGLETCEYKQRLASDAMYSHRRIRSMYVEFRVLAASDLLRAVWVFVE